MMTSVHARRYFADVAENLRLFRETELASLKDVWEKEASLYIEGLDHKKFIWGLKKGEDPVSYVKRSMEQSIDWKLGVDCSPFLLEKGDIESILEHGVLNRPCPCKLQALDAELCEMMRKDNYAQIMASAADYLADSKTLRRNNLSANKAREQAMFAREKLNVFKLHMKREQAIEKQIWGCVWLHNKHVIGPHAMYVLKKEKEELLIKIPYIYSKLLGILNKACKVKIA